MADGKAEHKMDPGSQKKKMDQTEDGNPVKSKAQLKAERRAKQEAQRAAKAAKQGKPASKQASNEGGAVKQTLEKKPESQDRQTVSSKEQVRVPDAMQMDTAQARKRMSKNLEKQQVPQRRVSQRKVALFSHLDQFERATELTKDIKFSTDCNLHPAIIKLGLQYAEGIICGSNARCVGLLAALKKVISDYSTPPQKELSRDLDARLKPYINFLKQCRPISVSMGNAIKFVKWQINHSPEHLSDDEAKKKIKAAIDDYWREKIILAGQAISDEACTKIMDGDVIMVYACSSLIRKVLCDAHNQGKKFFVIVVDGRPKLEGKEMLRRLVDYGIKCSYVLINAVPYVIREVTKVFLGAHALLANGYVMSRVGSSQVALIAKASNVPVLVCCETYKFCERVQTDSFVFNELGDPNDLVDGNDGRLSGWKDTTNLNLLNLMYDVTPPEMITLVITELGMLPCTSVPVVLRVRHAETEQ